MNLQPYVPVMVGQGILFCVAYVVVRGWIVRPYERLRNKRYEKTHGIKHDLSELAAQMAERKAQMEERKEAAFAEAKSIRAAAQKEALQASKDIVLSARKEADAQVEQAVQRVEAQWDGERDKLAQFARSLAQKLSHKLLSFEETPARK